MSSLKNQLKTARNALLNKDYSSACEAARQVLDHDPHNYNANVFLGLSLLELGHYEESEEVYLRAITLDADNPLAWQGISKLYERREAWEKYAESLSRLVMVYCSINETIKCAESWQRLVTLRRTQGTRLQLIEALCLLLPGSKLHKVLADLPAPDSTSTTLPTAQSAIYDPLSYIIEIVGLVEAYEEELIRKEVHKRKTRLGAASIETLTKEVRRETLTYSKLPLLYNEVLNHPGTSDDLRRSTDAKLLRHKILLLHSIPDTTELLHHKLKVLAEVDEMAKGAVLLRTPDVLAWTFVLESQDCETIAGCDHRIIQQFIELFPTSQTSLLLMGYLAHMNIDSSNIRIDKATSSEDSFDTILNACAAIPDSLIANRVLAEVYLVELDYENAIKAAENGLQVLRNFESNNGRKLFSTHTGFKTILVTSLVQLSSPRHHARAMHLIDEVLSHSPDNAACLMGQAYILEARSLWNDAASLFSRVEQLLPKDSTDGLRAREEYAWCHCHLQDKSIGLSLLHDVLDTLKSIEESGRNTARCLWRLGTCHLNMKSNREEAYRYYILSLRADPSYAPAFTSLGIYYAELSSPLDPRRASKCFQKAFELDAREIEAARRLAEGFAADQAWDLVEVIARRVVEGEDSLGVSFHPQSRSLPSKSWAWKAIGIVELYYGNYSQAIQAFQVLLSSDSDDSPSWVRLGEAYIKAGRHAAALKALERAYELNPTDWVCSYLIGDVKHQIGNFDDAIGIFESVLIRQPSQFGVLVSLGQAYLGQGRTEVSEGFYSRAEQSFVNCISTSLRTIQISSGFRSVVWKTLGDATYALSKRLTYCNNATIREALGKVTRFLSTEDVPPPIPGLSATIADDHFAPSSKALEIAILAYNYRASLVSSEAKRKDGSVWYDIGTALHSWYIRTPGNVASSDVHTKVISCLVRALREEPENALYWTGLGNAYFLSDARNAQHAYIKALEIDSKNTVAWTNLGLLCLHNDDVELASEILYRAQTLDPEYSVTWMGQALIATANGRVGESADKCSHALGLSPTVLQSGLYLSSQLLAQYRHSNYDAQTVDVLIRAFSILNHYCWWRPDDAAGLHLFALVCESLGHLRSAEDLLVRTISILEEVYEASEDPSVEHHFTTANSNLARVRLASLDFQGAIQSFENALGLLSDNTQPGVQVLSVQTLLGLGLGNFMQGNKRMALANFQAALEVSREDKVLTGHVAVLIAKAMWAIQIEGFGESSKAQLLDCVSTDPGNSMAINVLAGIGILTDDENLVDAALSELLDVSPEQRNGMDPEHHVSYLLMQYHLARDPKKAKSVAQSALFAQPSRPETRMSLARLLLKEHNASAALALLSGLENDGIKGMSDLLSLRAIAAGLTYDTTTALREAQRAVVLSPSNLHYWQTLAFARSHYSTLAKENS